jgi:hypothetical protein
MKTTIDISAPLLREAKRLAARDGVTLKTFVERGLQRVISERKQATPFKLRRASVKGEGLQPGVRDASWEQLLDMAYEGRG